MSGNNPYGVVECFNCKEPVQLTCGCGTDKCEPHVPDDQNDVAKAVATGICEECGDRLLRKPRAKGRSRKTCEKPDCQRKRAARLSLESYHRQKNRRPATVAP